MTTSARTFTRRALAAGAAAATVAGTIGLGAAAASAATPVAPKTVYTQTNDPAGNTVLAFRDDGSALTPLGRYPTGGLGTGDGLGSQGSVVLSSNERFLFAVNAGSDSVSGFAVGADGALSPLGQVASGGDRPISVAARNGVGWVLNGTSLDLASFSYDQTGVHEVGAPSRPLSPGAAGPAQVSFTPNGQRLVVSEKTSNTLDVFSGTAAGALSAPVSSGVAGTTPFGFGFSASGFAVVSEAGSTSAQTFRVRADGTAAGVDADSNGGQGAPCWVVVTRKGVAFTANAGATANSLSSFGVSDRGALFLLASRAAATDLHPTDLALGSTDARLFNLSDRSGSIDASSVATDGTLAGTAAAVTGLPTTIVGLAATNR